ncbi:killer cell lectin-like receptor subfamily G member 1 [Ovis canadensis]|uniref:killer cell lectin-like receptor subfamily G member 1 n=1 Tax=Ovis canadensis TaxID=37174 RepID=UPI00375269D7
MAFSSHLTHVLVLTDLNRSRVTPSKMPRVPGPCSGATCWGSFNGPEPAGLELMIRKQEKKATSSSRCPHSYHVALALGLLSTILASMLLLQWILYWGSKLPTCPGCPHCPDLWMGHGDHCYYFSVEKKSWNSSLEFCLAKDAHLLMFKDSKEMIQLQNLLSQEFYWIGLRNSSGWRWEDASALNVSRITSNSWVQNCGTISKSGLYASSCEVPLPWVCKRSDVDECSFCPVAP